MAETLALLVRWALVAFGLIYLVSESTIMSVPRIILAKKLGPLGQLGLYCHACVGFWIGLLTGTWLWPFRIEIIDGWLAVPLESGLACMTVGAIWHIYGGGNASWLSERVFFDDDAAEPIEARTGSDEDDDG